MSGLVRAGVLPGDSARHIQDERVEFVKQPNTRALTVVMEEV